MYRFLPPSYTGKWFLFFTFYFFLLISQEIVESLPKVTMLTPTDQRNLAFLSLAAEQKEEASGRFSSIDMASADDTNRVISFFDKDITTTTRKFILGSSPAILFLENHYFKILSSPSLSFGRNNHQTITGHFGDSLIHPNPIRISGDR